MRTPLLCLALALATTGCRKSVTFTSSTASTAPDTLVAGTVIRSAGTWSAHTKQGSQKLDVTVSGTSLSWAIHTEERLPGGGSSGGTGSSGMTLSAPSDPWFIFVQSPKKLWFFNGSTELSFNLSEGGGSNSGPAIHAGKLLPIDEKIPTDVIPLLPPDLQKLFPPVTPKTERPNF